jgi:hypothetical protein
MAEQPAPRAQEWPVPVAEPHTGVTPHRTARHGVGDQPQPVGLGGRGSSGSTDFIWWSSPSGNRRCSTSCARKKIASSTAVDTSALSPRSRNCWRHSRRPPRSAHSRGYRIPAASGPPPADSWCRPARAAQRSVPELLAQRCRLVDVTRPVRHVEIPQNLHQGYGRSWVGSQGSPTNAPWPMVPPVG